MKTELELMEEVISAARCIHHWHDTLYNEKTKETEGMIVSAKHVRELWQVLSDLDEKRRQT